MCAQAALIAAQLWAIGHSGINGRMLRALELQGSSIREVRRRMRCALYHPSAASRCAPARSRSARQMRHVLREHAETIGDAEGEEQREKRQRRLLRVVSTFYQIGARAHAPRLPRTCALGRDARPLRLGAGEPLDAPDAAAEEAAEAAEAAAPAAGGSGAGGGEGGEKDMDTRD